MGRLVQVAADRRAVLLPDGTAHRGGEQVILSDAQYALVPLGWLGTILTDLGPTSYPSDPPADAAADTPSLRTLGAGGQQAAAGSHTHAGGGGGSGAALGTATPQPLGAAAAGTAVAASHEDHIHAIPPSDPSAGTAGLRTLGTGSTQAAAGNDARLSDSRAPTTHATSHASAGSDPVTPAAIGASATGHTHTGTYDATGTAAAAVAAIPTDGTSGTASLRTLGTGGQQAAGGGHTHAVVGPRLVRALITSGSAGGDTPASTSGAWARYTPVGTLAIDAVAGDYVEVLMSLLTNRSDTALIFDLAVYVGGSAVWYASTETSTPATEGDPALYPTLSPRGWYAGLLIGSGHLSSGQVTFGLGHKSSGSGKLYYSTDYPMRWRALNFGPPRT